MYTYGSAAGKIDINESFQPRVVSASKKQKEEAMIAQWKENVKRKALKSLAVITAILAVIMIREAQIDKLCGEISKKEAEIASLDAMIAEKEMYLSGQMDLNTIEEIAVTRLGMQKITTDDYVVINVVREEGGEILAEEQESSSGFSAFINTTKNLLEYLD